MLYFFYRLITHFRLTIVNNTKGLKRLKELIILDCYKRYNMGTIHRIAVTIFFCYSRLSSGEVTPSLTQYVTQKQADVNLVCSATEDVQ